MNPAVILMAYGSPDRLSDVPAYYADIRGGRPISPESLEDLVARYRALGIDESDGPSPLNAVTEETRTGLETALDLPVFTGMRHWAPRIGDAIEAAIAGGYDPLVGLVLAPHWSSLSIEKYRRLFDDVVAGRVESRFVERWGADPGFIAVLADRVRDTSAHVVFTAHSLPARILDEGDPYRDELLETARLVAEQAGIEAWSFSFQSESPTGEPWLGPDILDHLDALHERGVDDVLVCPVGFVSDHLEIRWDIDHEAKERAAELGMRLERIAMPNSDPAFVDVLAGIVRRELRPAVTACVELRPLREDEFLAWSEDARAWYAVDLVENGGMRQAPAEEKAKADTAALFADGFSTAGNVLLVVEEDGVAVGSVWFAAREQHGEKYAFLYAIKLHEQHRGRGLGRQAMLLLEEEVRAQGFDRIMLNVFGGNERARSLYRGLGYDEAAVHMLKAI